MYEAKGTSAGVKQVVADQDETMVRIGVDGFRGEGHSSRA